MSLWSSRTGLAFALAAMLFAVSSTTAYAGSLLSSVVESLSASNARVVMFLPGGLPQNWLVEGSGTDVITVTLPNTVTGPGFHADSPTQPSIMESVSVVSNANSVRVVVRLKSSMRVVAHALPSALILEIGQPEPSVPAASALPTIGTIYTVITLKYADVTEVANILTQSQLQPTDVFHPTASAFSLPNSASEPNTVGADFSANVLPTILGERLNETVAIDRRLNALIVSGTPAQVASIKDLVAQIDIPVDSVMLDCKIVELTASSARDLGLAFSEAASGPVGQATLSLGNSSNSGITGTQFTASFSAQLFATIAHGGGRVLATPSILAVDGVPAQILAGNAIPIVQSTIYPGSSAVTQVSTNYLTVGINLEILPRIRGDDNVDSHIYAEVSSVAAYVATSQGNVPEVSLRRASTEALVHDGSPFVIAGLLEDNEITNMSKIPILGDMPLIGALFRTTHNSTEHTNLYIVITPHIVRMVPH